MYIVDPGLSWMDYPLLYTREGLVKSNDQIRRIQDEGFTTCFVEMQHDDGFLQVQAEKLQPLQPQPREGALKESRYPRACEEYPRARKVYADSLRAVRGLLQDARNGKAIDYHQSSAMVESIVDSLDRHPDSITSLSKLQQYDNYTFSHSLNVCIFSLSMGKMLNWSVNGLRQLGIAGLFHDLGKVRMPLEVLNKPGRLTGEEFDLIKSHPFEGYKLLLKNGALPEEILEGVLQHHEKLSGKGYPKGLREDEISELAKILAIIDVYDALTSRRPYKDGISQHQALKIIFEMRGSDFDSRLVEQFVKVVGVYPIGSYVQLSSMEYGLVVDKKGASSLRPVVKVIRTMEGRPLAQRLVDLAEDKELAIVGCFDPRRHKVNPASYMLPRQSN